MAAEGVDVFVIGGGITGAAVAMDAAARGYRVGLTDRGDFASGTSSRSTKLIHGGIRYLPQFDFALVREALVERGLLFQNAPWIVEPLAFVLPLYSWNRRPLGAPLTLPFGIGAGAMVEAGLLTYDLFAGRYNVRRHQRIPIAEAIRLAPGLNPADLTHAFVYYDGQTDDSRLTLTVLLTAVSRGALAANYVEATGFQLSATGDIQAVRVLDTIKGRELVVRARHVVNAAGVFAQRVEELTGMPSNLRIRPAKGVHLVVARESVPMGPPHTAIVLPETDDGRLLFVIPWEGRVLIGTTDTAGSADIDGPATTEGDVEYLLRHCNRYLRTELTASDVISSFAGYRPLITHSSSKAATARLSRGHAVIDGPGGMVSVVGGKLTTWRKMGEDAVNRIAERDGLPPSSATRQLQLAGTDGWREAQTELSEFSSDVRSHLIRAYGAAATQVALISRFSAKLGGRIVPGLPYLKAEVIHACRAEMALTLADVLCRRTRIVIEDLDQGSKVAHDVADLMAAELGWKKAEVDRQVDSYLQTIGEEYRPR